MAAPFNVHRFQSDVPQESVTARKPDYFDSAAEQQKKKKKIKPRPSAEQHDRHAVVRHVQQPAQLEVVEDL
ncbi:hypothetical protein CYMTET_7828 [Cymbomonas tetramitiformis]|uniref:Uncharacterized protein n=1 Tax=Cymbomonas tetramitiformis TaxID=36881 RepID=A0AAE0GUR2_9CHLO|nr:hypothetical protein CYMTET_7828 [Cymbomonas tetramitiformis]